MSMYNVTISLHELPTFSTYSLAYTGSSCLPRCYDYIMTCASVRVQNVCTFICDHNMFSIYSTTARLYGAQLIFAYGAGLPRRSLGQEKVMEVSGHHCIIKIWDSLILRPRPQGGKMSGIHWAVLRARRMQHVMWFAWRHIVLAWQRINCSHTQQ